MQWSFNSGDISCLKFDRQSDSVFVDAGIIIKHWKYSWHVYNAQVGSFINYFKITPSPLILPNNSLLLRFQNKLFYYNMRLSYFIARINYVKSYS